MIYEVSNIAPKLISTDDKKDVIVAIKATVTNNSDDEDVLIKLQGVDADEFEVETFYLEGNIPIGGTRTLTKRKDMSRKLYEQITCWRRQ